MSPGVDRGGIRNPPPGVLAAWNTIAECDQQIEAGRDFLVLVLGNRKPPTGLRARLTPYGGPLGEILNYSADLDGGRIVARFEPNSVKLFLTNVLIENGWEA